MPSPKSIPVEAAHDSIAASAPYGESDVGLAKQNLWPINWTISSSFYKRGKARGGGRRNVRFRNVFQQVSDRRKQVGQKVSGQGLDIEPGRILLRAYILG